MRQLSRRQSAPSNATWPHDHSIEATVMAALYMCASLCTSQPQQHSHCPRCTALQPQVVRHVSALARTLPALGWVVRPVQHTQPPSTLPQSCSSHGSPHPTYTIVSQGFACLPATHKTLLLHQIRGCSLCRRGPHSHITSPIEGCGLPATSLKSRERLSHQLNSFVQWEGHKQVLGNTSQLSSGHRLHDLGGH